MQITKKNLGKIFGLLIAMSGALPAATGDGPKGEPSPYEVLASFVGGVWTGVLPVEEGKPPARIEMRFAWAENRQGVRTDATWIAGEKRAPYTSGMYAWDGAKRKLVLFYTDSSGSLTEGTITQENAALVHDLMVTAPDGTLEPVRAVITKVGADVFLNKILLKQEGEWKPFVEVRYERKS